LSFLTLVVVSLLTRGKDKSETVRAV